MSKLKRVVRVLVYQGDPHWVDETLRGSSVRGHRVIDGHNSIHEVVADGEELELPPLYDEVSNARTLLYDVVQEFHQQHTAAALNTVYTDCSHPICRRASARIKRMDELCVALV